MSGKNKNMHAAKRNKNDEFYTQLSDIERELYHYRDHFRGKVVYCNCDDPEESNFFKYFSLKFEELGLRRLIATCYSADGRGRVLIYDGDKNGNRVPDPEEIEVRQLEGDGDFRSPESIALLQEADIVVSNPPFSLFREYIAQLVEYDKKFLVVGHQNAITYKEIFPLIKGGDVWLGYGFRGAAAHFINRHYEDYAAAGDHREGMIRVSGVVWFTNLDHDKRHEPLILYKKYHDDPDAYPTYDNYDAIEVSKTKNIPADYYGVMGVPITFLDKHCPEQFEIVGITDRSNDSGLKTRVYTKDDAPNAGDLNARGVVRLDGRYKAIYARILIKRNK